MPAIITDQYRILNAETFVDSFVGIGTTGNNNYYTFLGHPNPTYIGVSNYGTTDWGTPVPNPIDNFSQESFYYDSMLFLKKVTSNDVRRVVPRIDWQSGTVYEMFRSNYSATNLTPQSKSTTLYGASYYVVTSEFKVYLCINNGTDPTNPRGQGSQFEPIHTNTAPDIAGNGSDGYLWKYLYTIAPSDIVKFVTSTYIPLPKEWGDITTQNIKNAAVDGKIETIIIKDGGSGHNFTDADGNIQQGGSIGNVPIVGDGTGGLATIEFNDGVVTGISVADGGSGYTQAAVKFTNETFGDQTLSPGTGGEFEVIIPPKGGHGFDVYRELGAFRVMLYSKYDNNVDHAPDYVIGNDFSRVGLVKNPLQLNGTDLLNSTTASNLSALKLKPESTSGLTTSQFKFASNVQITQTLSSVGLGSTAVGHVASWDPDTGILKYYQPVGYSTSSTYSFKKLDFSGENENGPVIIGSTNTANNNDKLVIDTGFNGSSIDIGGRSISLSSTFVSGKAPADVKKYSGDIIYIDNRAPIERTTSQKEEVKIVIEF